MKKQLFLTFLFISTVGFSQKKVVKKFETNTEEINIYTDGLDDIILENSNSSFVEVYLEAESYDNQIIKIEEANKEVDVKFYFEGTETREVVFRKYITKRLQRASVVIKIPKGKKVNILGGNVDVESKNLKNELAIYIENGIVKLNQIQANTTLKLYSGNVYASIKKTNIDVTSNTGKIKVDDKFIEKTYKLEDKKFKLNFKLSSIKANVFLDL